MLPAVMIAVMLGVVLNEGLSAALDKGFIVHDSEANDGKPPSYVPSSLAKRFDHDVYHRPGNGKTDEVRFRLFSPTKSDEDRKYPLLVWLHGVGESGTDNVAHLRWLDLVVKPGKPTPPMFIVAVQCPKRDVSWSATDPTLSPLADRIALTLEIVSCLQRELAIDPNRIYLSGVSSGANACWEMALREPKLFAAVAPLAGAGPLSKNLASIKDVPVWAFHNADDTDLPFDSVEKTVNSLQQAGGTVALTQLLSVPARGSHNCWTAAFEDYQLADWLLQQDRDGDDAPLPGAVPLAARWNMFRRDYVDRYWPVAWPRLLTLAVILGIVFLARREMRKSVRA